MTETSTCLQTQLAGISMRTPVMVASGTFGYGPEYADLIDLNELGAMVVKGICLEGAPGNPTPRLAETPSGLLNAIGLQNPGVKGFLQNYMPFLERYDVPVLVNIWGRSIQEYADVAACLDADGRAAGLEVNVSCPNIKEGGNLFGTDLDLFRQVIDAVRAATDLPIIPKLSPNVSCIADFARAAESCGADALSLINSYPALVIDTTTWEPAIANGTGGLSGPAIRPIALKLVWEAARAVDIPVIGMGGICTADDAVQFLLAGASAVSVGTANFIWPNSAIEVARGLQTYIESRGLSHVRELVGAATW